MPIMAHPVTFTVYKKDNTTLANAVKVFVRNVTKKTTSTIVATNSSGVAIIDMADLPLAAGQTNQYDTGDDVLLVAYDRATGTSAAALYTVTGNSKDQTLYLNPIPFQSPDNGTDIQFTEKVSISQVTVTSTNGTSYYAKIYALQDGQLLDHIEPPTTGSMPVYYGKPGKAAGYGYVVEVENQNLLVTALHR